MARLAVKTAVFFFFFVVSHARFPFDLPENDFPIQDPLTNLPDAVQKQTTTENKPEPEIETQTETETETLPRIEYEVTESNLPEQDIKTTTTSSSSSSSSSTEDIPGTEVTEPDTDTDTDSTPITMISFHPINRHFPLRPFPPFRHHRPCRHHHHQHHHQFKPLTPRFRGIDQIPYVNDVILSIERDDEMNFDHVLRTVPSRWMRFHHHGGGGGGATRFPYIERQDVNSREEMRKSDQHRNGEGEEDKQKDEDHGIGFMSSFRKFLKHNI